MRYDEMYIKCKKFCEVFENCEEYLKILMETMNIEDEEELNKTTEEMMEEIYKPCRFFKLNLESEIIDNFIQTLDEDLQKQIMDYCFKTVTEVFKDEIIDKDIEE